MIYNRLLALVVAGLAFPILQSSEAQAAPLELEPSSKWELDYAEDSCALRRMFGTGDKRAQIEIRKFQPGDVMQVVIASNISRTRKRAFRYRFVPGEDWSTNDGKLFMTFGKDFAGSIFTSSIVSWADESEPAKYELSPPEYRAKYISSELAAADKIAGFEIEKLFNSSILLKTGSLRAPLEAMNACLDELVSHWGIDVEAHKTLKRAPQPIEIEKVGRMVDYPPKMLIKNMPGYVNVRLDVDERGLVTNCHIQMPLSDPEFEESSCADIQHALEFEPALDKDGNPIASYFVTRVIFMIGW